jgi:signal transduction histidine kinase
MLSKGLKIAKNQLGLEHPYVATNLNNLGKLLKNLGKFSEAEPLFREALKIREKRLGHDHPDTAKNLSDLGLVLQAQRKYSQAEPLFREAIRILQLHPGKEQSEVSKSLNNLALLLKYQGKYEEAEKFFYQALNIREKQLGSDHPDVANSLNNLAGLLQAQGRYADAEKLFRRALKIYESRLGAEQVAITFDYVRINSELERRALELEKANEDLKELDRKKSEFLSTVSHELRTPLAPIKSCLEGMLKERYGKINEIQRNRLEIALVSVNDEVRLIDNLLDLVRIQEKRVALDIEHVSVKEIICNVAQQLEYDAKNKRINFKLEIPGKDLLAIQLDKGKIKQVIINLIYNAIKFTPDGGTIEVSASREEEFIKIAVSDSGCGIPEDKLEKIFERFYQIDSSLTRKIGGSGIGLSIVKEFVELHGGQISVESKPEVGSVFTFTLPFRD